MKDVAGGSVNYTKNLVVLEEYGGPKPMSLAYQTTPNTLNMASSLLRNAAESALRPQSAKLRSEVLRERVSVGGYRSYTEVLSFSLNIGKDVGVAYSSDTAIKYGIFWVEKKGTIKGDLVVVRGLEAVGEAVSENFADALKAEFGKDKNSLLVPKSGNIDPSRDGTVTLTDDYDLYRRYAPAGT